MSPCGARLPDWQALLDAAKRGRFGATYAKRLLEAAAGIGLAVAAPGAYDA